MPVFPDLEIEAVVQVNDRTRLSASKSFASQDQGNINKVEIDPGTGTYLDVTPTDPLDVPNYFLDYLWGTAGVKTLRCRITCDEGSPEEISKSITVVTEESDQLFASDDDLAGAEPDIKKWVSPGRNSFKNIHRACQYEIIRYLDEKGYTDAQANPLTKAAILDNNEVNLWAKFMALRMIFQGLINSSDDVFSKKSDYYQDLEHTHRDKMLLRLDVDGDGTTSPGEGVFLSSGSLFRR